MMDNKWYIIRTVHAGVFFGHIKERNGDEVVLTDVRRLWYWSGATSLSQMAMEGVRHPENCKFSGAVLEMVVLGVIEIIPCTDEAVNSIRSVREWRV